MTFKNFIWLSIIDTLNIRGAGGEDIPSVSPMMHAFFNYLYFIQEEALKKEQDLEMGGWVSKSNQEENKDTRVTECPTTSQKY